MNHVEVKSTNIQSIGYDEETQTMEVRFQKTGLLYSYEPVPESLHAQLMRAASKGQFFSKNIRNNTKINCTFVEELVPPTGTVEAHAALIEQATGRMHRTGTVPQIVKYDTVKDIDAHVQESLEQKKKFTGVIPEEKLKE